MYGNIVKNWEKLKYIIAFLIIACFSLLLTVVYKSDEKVIKKTEISRLEEYIRNFEPELALNGGSNGYSKIEKVIEKSSYLLKSNGKLILEIGYDQANFSSRLLKKYGFKINKISKDLSGKDRCIVSTIN